MINIYDELLKTVSCVNFEILDLINDTKNIPQIMPPDFSKLRLFCENIASELEKNTIRVAVVGTLKSGKSTFVNSLFGKDYLKRGAGVLTSIVTRVRNSNNDQATLFLKTWKEINKDIEQSIKIFPYPDKSPKNKIDIRQQKDREYLENVLDSFKYEQITTRDLNINYTLLLSYLKGYKKINKYITKENKSIKFSKKELILHRDFVTNDHLSVYLKDVLLEIEGEKLGNNIEIADCQGSDSLNPLHLSMVQNYLNTAHLVIYVISSRTGIKEADIKFINLIKKIGLITNTIFIVNVDLNEHDSIQDIRRLIFNTKEYLLSTNKFSFQMFAFSALHNLMLYNNPTAISKTISDFINQEYEHFLDHFNRKLNSDRYFLLINNHIHKLKMISQNLENWIKMTNYILMSNRKKSKQIINDITISYSELLNIKTTIDKSIKGSVKQIKKELFLNIDRFFGDHYQGAISKTIQFIHEWSFDFNKLNKNISDSVVKDLYTIFQDFKQALEKHVYEVINPNIVEFVREEEEKLIKHVTSLSNLYSSMFYDLTKKYNTKTKNLNLKDSLKPSKIEIKLNPIRSQVKLSSMTFNAVKYNRRVKIEAAIYFYLKMGIQYLLKVVKPRFLREQSLHVATVKRAMEQIKKETEISTAYYLKNHRENIKFQHIVPIIKIVSEDVEQQISSQININIIELDKISGLIKLKKLKKEKTLEGLKDITKKLIRIKTKIKQTSLETSKIKM